MGDSGEIASFVIGAIVVVACGFVFRGRMSTTILVSGTLLVAILH